jgi:hypothetical protein
VCIWRDLIDAGLGPERMIIPLDLKKLADTSDGPPTGGRSFARGRRRSSQRARGEGVDLAAEPRLLTSMVREAL